MALPFSEWSREAKDEFAQKRMEEMKLKNEALKQRYAEVEQDRIKAEAKDSAVTAISKKENIVVEKEEDILKVEREWDREKLDQDAEDWNPPKFYGYRSKTPRRNFPDRSSPKKENWRVRSANVGKDRQSYSKFKSSGPNHKYQEYSNYGASGFRNENASFSKQRDRAYRTSSGTYRSFQNSRLDEPRKKSISGGAGSASPSLSDSELEPVKLKSKVEIDRMWEGLGSSEVQHKQSRVEKWVKAINTANCWKEDFEGIKGNVFYAKRAEERQRDNAKRYGYANEEDYPKKNQSSRDQTHSKNRERYDGWKYGQSSRGNSRARGNGTPTGERTTGGFEDKNQRNFRKRNYSDKNKFRRESDLSDRTSSMKESDYRGRNKDKFNKTASDSKSSDYSGVWEDVECDIKYDSEKRPFNKKSSNNPGKLENEGCDVKYALEKRPFDKQSNARNYGKDKVNKSKDVQSPTLSSSQGERKKDEFDDEYARNTRQKFPDSYVKDKSKTKNMRNTDHSGFDDQHLENRASARKVKSNKYKTESKFVGHSEKFENESTVDNQAITSKYKTSKPSPKRILNNPVKSIDISSSASRTVEFNSNDDVWGDYVQDTFGNTERNDSQTEHKCSLVEEEADVNKVSLPLDWSTPVKTDCDTSSEKLSCQNSELNYEVSGNAVPDLKALAILSKSSSASRTGEFNSNSDDIWGDYKQDTFGNIERNDSQTEHKCSLVEEEADVNEVSLPLDWSTPVKTECDTSSEKLFYQNYEVSGDAIPELHDNNVEDNNIESTCPNETSEIEKHGAAVDYNVPTDDTHDDSIDNVEYSGDQNEGDIKVQHPISDVVNTTVDSCEDKNSAGIDTNESKSSLSEVSIPELQNSQDKTVQSTETELNSSKLPDNINLERSGLEVAQEKISVNESSNNTDCETSTEQAVENKEESAHCEIKALSSQSTNTACTKFDSESALKSSDLVTAAPQYPGFHRKYLAITLNCLNVSDDDGWSTASEDENNASDDKNN